MRFKRLLLVFVLFLFIVSFVFAYNPFFTDYNNFDEGTYNNTFLNGDYIGLAGNNLTGEYYSKIYESEIMGVYTQWHNMSWSKIPFLFGEFPNNQAVEDGANMTGNILLLHFNETSGVVYDWSGNGYVGIPNGGITYNETGYFNNALSFDGVDDYINFTNTLILNVNDTISGIFWIKTTYQGNQIIFSKQQSTGNYRGYSVLIDGSKNNTIFFQLTHDGTERIVINGITDLADGNWHFVAFNYNGTRNASDFIFYVDGVIEEIGEISFNSLTENSNITNNINFQLSGRNGVNLIFNGTIDELALWNRTLTMTEINDYYLRGFPDINISVKSCSNYDCSDSNFTILDDTSPQNLNFLERNKYFQYKADFYTQNSSISPKLYNVSVYYIRNTTIADEEIDNIYWDINDSLPSNATTTIYGYNLESLFDGNVNSNWLAQSGSADFFIGGYYVGCAFCSANKRCEDAWFIINLTETYDITRFKTYIHSSTTTSYIWSADKYYNGTWSNINTYTDTIGSGWNEKEWNIEDVDAIKISLQGSSSTCSDSYDGNAVAWYEIEIYGYPAINDVVSNCEDYNNCILMEDFNNCEGDILEIGWYGQSIACEDGALLCNTSNLTSQFYRPFPTVDNNDGDIVIRFGLEIFNNDYSLKIDLGHNDEYAIRLKFDEGIIYDNDRNQPLISYEENVEYDYRLVLNLANQNYVLYRDDKKMDLTEESSISFYNTLNVLNFIQFVPDLYNPVKNCEWKLDYMNIFTEEAFNITETSKQMFAGIDFRNGSAGFDKSVCRQNENTNICFARNILTDGLTYLKNWILGGLILFVILLIIIFLVLMFKHNN